MEPLKHNSNTRVTGKDLSLALTAMGIGPRSTLMVHSSIKSFGYFEGGIDAVLDTLLSQVGEEGTLCVPTLTGTREDGEKGPIYFDARTTSCWTGKLCETLRRRPTAIRSDHPTHSIAAIGAAATSLTNDHHLALTPCGEGSPWLRLAEARASLLFIGVNLSCCTLLHTAEELANVDYHMKKEPCEAFVTDSTGRQYHGWFKIHDWGTPRRFHEALYPELVQNQLIQSCRVGNSMLLTCRADQLLDLVVSRLRREPRWLVKVVG